jgi:outer membrane protein TolC
VVGLPAQLLRNRPDVRRAERELAAQSARIGIAASDFYPRLQLVGNLSFEAEDAANLFKGSSFAAFGGPSFRWAILNYGRIAGNVRVQDALFQQRVGLYEDAVLRAQQEVQDAMAGFVGARRGVEFLSRSAADSALAVELAELQYREGATDYTRVLLSQQFLLDAQARLVATRGAVALNFVSLQRSLGNGRDYRTGEALVRPATRDEMSDRVGWGNLLDAGRENAILEDADESEGRALRWWWPQW